MPSADPTQPGDLAETFRSLAEIVYAHARYEDIYRSICDTAVEVIPGCDHACVSTLQAGGRLTCAGASDDVARFVDSLERETGEGPCLDAILEERYQHDSDITARATWPTLARLVLGSTPVRGMVSYRMKVGGRKAGALNVFSDTPGALTERSADLGAVVASFASVALGAASQRERAETLRRGLESNREIGKAIGLLMATHGISDDEAFRTLRTVSSEMNVKLAEVARRVVAERRRAEG